jgi:hypothetical protein
VLLWVLGVNVRLNGQQFIGPLFDDAKILQHIAFRYTSCRSQHIVNGRPVAVDFVEQGLNTWGQTMLKNYGKMYDNG